jgi:hypothetical protein
MPLLRWPSAYLGLPILLACSLTLLTYDLPDGYLPGILLLMTTAAAILFVDAFSTTRLPAMVSFRRHRYAGTRDAFVALAFAALVVLACLIDLTAFSIPLIDNPASYATMENGREHVRHISDMCWTLPPIGLLCVRRRWLRNALILVGLVFPILVIDRNRLFAGLIAMALVIVFRRDESRPLPWKIIGLLALAGGVAFSVLGTLRSGSIEHVTLPFGSLYLAMPQAIKWLLLYTSAGPYNFGGILARHYVNTDFLVNQLVPFNGSVATAGTDIPLDASNINIGTEFFPFAMAMGPLGAVAAMVGLYAMLRWSAWLLRRASLFPLLIFLRVAYVAVMSPFAPQAYTFTHVGFIALCLAMQLFAAWLPDRRARDVSPPLEASAHANG